MNIRRRLRDSKLSATVLAGLLASYARLCFATTRWTVEGLDDLTEDLKKGPVILVLWHSRVMFGQLAWPSELGQQYSLMDPSPVGRIGARFQELLGANAVSMKASASNFAATRKILQIIRDGHCIGIAADGPEGPARQAKQAALDWARAAKCPVYLFAWSTRSATRLKTWDRMLVAFPFSRGAIVHRRWSGIIPRKPSAEQNLQLRENLSQELDATVARSAEVIGVSREI